jgi:hypothetical protein
MEVKWFGKFFYKFPKIFIGFSAVFGGKFYEITSELKEYMAANVG